MRNELKNKLKKYILVVGIAIFSIFGVNIFKMIYDMNTKNTVEESISYMDAYKAVMLNKKPLYFSKKQMHENEEVFDECYDVYMNIPQMNGSTNLKISGFCIIDLDNSGVPEILLSYENYFGFVILLYRDGEVYGTPVGYRIMHTHKQNGMFWTGSGAGGGTAIGKMVFIDGVPIRKDVLKEYPTYEGTNYYKNGIAISEQEWQKERELFSQEPDVEWHLFTEEKIKQVVVETEKITEDKKWARERQEYLNNLIYLVEYTYNSTKSEEDIKQNARLYYDGCVDELDRIYQACVEKLSGEKKAALINEQKMWEDTWMIFDLDNIKSESNAEILFEYGDEALDRIIYLVEIFYNL